MVIVSPKPAGFQSTKARERDRRLLRQRRQQVLDRIAPRPEPERDAPMITATNIHYELADRVQGLAAGGIGALLLVARRTGLIADIDHNLHLLKRHLPYHESDHVLNIAFNILAGGQRIEHLELRRNDEVYLNALGAERIPDPTTEGDFCRRFPEADVLALMDAINAARLRVWAQQPAEFFDEAILDVDGTLVGTDAECKEGVDIAYDGTWGYHPLLISLANTAEPLFLVNRSGNRPSHEGAARLPRQGRSPSAARPASARSLLRGDTDFTQTKHLDRWDARRRHPLPLRHRRDAQPQGPGRGPPGRRRTASWSDRRGMRSRPCPASSPSGSRPEIVRRARVRDDPPARGDGRRVRLSPGRLRAGAIAWSCSASGWGSTRGRCGCSRSIATSSTSPTTATTTADEIVFSANDRCDQENLIAQLKGGVHALTTPVDDLVSNWAYMVMARLAWSLKAWAALLVPVSPRHAAKHRAEKRTLLRMEFATFRAAVIEMPCQIVRSGGRLIYRLLSWNPWQGMFLRLVERLQGCWLC